MKTIEDVIPDPEKIPPGKRSQVQRAAVFAKRVRNAVPYHPQGDTINFKELKGKPVEFVDKECKIRVMRCVEVKGLSQVKVEDFIEGTKKNRKTGEMKSSGKRVIHWIQVSQITGAFARKGTAHRLEVVF